MSNKFYYLIFIIFLLCNCRTMQLNQDANVIGRGASETSIGGGVAFQGNITNCKTLLGGFDLNIEFQQRFGIGDKSEFQIKGHTDFNLGGTEKSGFLFYNTNVINLGIKVDLLGIGTHGCALMPFIGLTYSMNNTRTKGTRYNKDVNINYAFDPNIGIMFLGSKDFYKRNLYWGGIVNISPNIAGIATGLPSQSTFDLDFSFNMGWEKLAYKVIYRNEFSIFAGFTFNFLDYTEYIEKEDTHEEKPRGSLTVLPNLLVFDFGISYHFSAAFRKN